MKCRGSKVNFHDNNAKQLHYYLTNNKGCFRRNVLICLLNPNNSWEALILISETNVRVQDVTKHLKCLIIVDALFFNEYIVKYCLACLIKILLTSWRTSWAEKPCCVFFRLFERNKKRRRSSFGLFSTGVLDE